MNRPHDVEGEFRLLSPKEGGRHRPVISGYRPTHKLHENYLTSGQHEYLGVDQIAPGEVARVGVWFITPDVYPRSLWIGREIDVMEGSRIIGKLVITKIFNHILSGSPETYSPVWIEPPGLNVHGERIDG
jgi:elongation factor Tu